MSMATIEIEKVNDLRGLLYLISKASGGFPFRIRLQKLVLLAKLEAKYPFSFKYASYFYGPYSPELQSTLGEIISAGLVKEESREMTDSRSGYFYSLTKEGTDYLADLAMPASEKEKLDKLWEKYEKYGTDALVKVAKEISGIKSIGD